MVHVEYDPEADAAYVHLTGNELAAGRRTIELECPPESTGTVLMDWKAGKIAGIEIIGASDLLNQDILSQATRPGRG